MTRKYILFLIGFLLSQNLLLAQGQSPEVLAYIDLYKDIAIQEMERTGIPASIKLAQGILESDIGRSYLARTANNHFGIKCGSNWNGKTAYKKDDDYNDAGRLVESCFRAYNTAEACYIAHSEFLRDPKKHERYGFLFELDHTDYRRWAHGLKKAGYATSNTYPQKLIDLIERYELYQYDRMSSMDIDTPSEEFIAGLIMVTNDVKYTTAAPQETVEDIAQRTRTALRRLIKYNENLNDSGQVLQEGEKVYMQPKRNYFRGRQQFHTVGPDETMMDISNMYALKLSKLYKRNLLKPGEEPAPNTEIKLRGSKVKVKPRLRQPGEIIRKPATAAAPITTAQPGGTNGGYPPPYSGNNGTTPIAPYQPPASTGQPGANPLPPPNSFEDPTTAPKPEENVPATPPPPAPVNEVLPSPPAGPDPLPPPTVISKPAGGNQAGASPASSTTYHTVIDGDTLPSIARRYGTTVDKLVELNRLGSNSVSTGQVLRVQ